MRRTTLTSPRSAYPTRGEIWRVNFDPIIGEEISKIRPAVVISPDYVGKLALRIVVPVTGWDARFDSTPWMVRLEAGRSSGLEKVSTADCFQVKSLSLRRFVSKLGDLREGEVEEIMAAVALCIGF